MNPDQTQYLGLVVSMIEIGIAVILIITALSIIRVVREYNRLVVFRLGRVQPVRGPGLTFVIPFIERSVSVEMWVDTIELKPQDVITSDNVSIKITAVLYCQVRDAVKSEIEVAAWDDAAEQLSYKVLRSLAGRSSLDEILKSSDIIAKQLQTEVDTVTEKWGVQISMVEIKSIDVPDNMQRAIAAEAEAERQRRAKIINAAGELEASVKLAEAAKALSASPEAMQLRYLQTISQIGIENNTTIILPIPMEFFKVATK